MTSNTPGAWMVWASLVLFPSVGAAIQPLDEFQQSASRHNLETHAAEIAAQMHHNDTTMARMRLGPSLSITAGFTHNQNEIAPRIPLPDGTVLTATIQPYNQFDANISLSVPLVDVLAWQKIRIAQTIEDGSRDRVAMSRLEVSRAVVQGWHSLVAAEATITAAQQALQVAQSNREVTLRRKDLGSSSEIDVARATAEIERVRQTVAEAQLGRALAARALESVSGLTPSAGAPAVDDDLHEEPPVVLVDHAQPDSPTIRLAVNETQAARQAITAAWTGLIPTVSAFVTERITNAAGFGFPAQASFGIMLTWRGDLTAPWAIMATYTTLSLAQTREQIVRNAANDEMMNAWERVHAAIAKSQAARAQVTAANEGARIARDVFASGSGTQLEVMQTERDAFVAEVGRIRADAELQMYRALLHLALGDVPNVTVAAPRN